MRENLGELFLGRISWRKFLMGFLGAIPLGLMLQAFSLSRGDVPRFDIAGLQPEDFCGNI